jgi:ribosomal protein S19
MEREQMERGQSKEDKEKNKKQRIQSKENRAKSITITHSRCSVLFPLLI